uniref:Transmembrane protein n=1 Tax=Clandestinovirus TaxID=2831644 RepID=A0A8F8KM05_9VIRU|nr:transmembrane protein [Clandestinovirus]
MATLATILAKSGRFNCLTPKQVAQCDPTELSDRKPLLIQCSQVGYWSRVTPEDCPYTLAVTSCVDLDSQVEIRIFTTLKYVYDRIASSGAFGICDPEDPYACIIVNPLITTMADHANSLHFVEGYEPIDPNSEQGRCIVMTIDNLSTVIVKNQVVHAPKPTSVFHPKRIMGDRSTSSLSKKFETLTKYFPEEYRDYKFDDIARPDTNINDHPYYWSSQSGRILQVWRKKRRLASCLVSTVERTLWIILGAITLSMLIWWMDN